MAKIYWLSYENNRKLDKLSSELAQATYKGDIKEVTRIMGEKGGPNVAEANLDRAIGAVVYGKPEELEARLAIVKAVIKNGAAVNESLLSRAMDRMDFATGSSYTEYVQDTPLHKAAQYAGWGYKGSLEIMKILIDNGAKVNAIGKDKDTPLHRAAYGASSEAVELLLKNDAKINAKNKYEATPLHMAAERGVEKTIEILLRNGADLKAKDVSGNTPQEVAKLSLQRITDKAWTQRVNEMLTPKSKEETKPKTKLRSAA